jgi:hypothetical protein
VKAELTGSTGVSSSSMTFTLILVDPFSICVSDTVALVTAIENFEYIIGRTTTKDAVWSNRGETETDYENCPRHYKITDDSGSVDGYDTNLFSLDTATG